jgi:hypothetical protein
VRNASGTIELFEDDWKHGLQTAAEIAGLPWNVMEFRHEGSDDSWERSNSHSSACRRRIEVRISAVLGALRRARAVLSPHPYIDCD